MLLNINLSKLLADALPTMLRKPKMLALLESLLKPVKDLYQQFSITVLVSRNELAYNSQTIVFESALNDLFDELARRLYIVNNPDALPLQYEFARSEGEPDVFDFARSEGEPDEFEYSSLEYRVPVGFQVVVPAALAAKEKSLRTFIEKIKFSHIRYEIIYI